MSYDAKPIICSLCGREMSHNPHPDAGKYDRYLEVGAEQVCIPCTVKARLELAKRALEAETRIIQLQNTIDEYCLIRGRE